MGLQCHCKCISMKTAVAILKVNLSARPKQQQWRSEEGIQNVEKDFTDHFLSETDVCFRDSIITLWIKKPCWRCGKNDLNSWIVGHPIKIKTFLIVTSWRGDTDALQRMRKEQTHFNRRGIERQLTSTIRTFWWQHVGGRETEENNYSWLERQRK